MFKTLQEAQEEEKIADIFGLEKEDGKWRFIIRNGAGKKLHYIDFSEEVSEFKSFLSLVWDSAYRAGVEKCAEAVPEEKSRLSVIEARLRNTVSNLEKYLKHVENR